MTKKLTQTELQRRVKNLMIELAKNELTTLYYLPGYSAKYRIYYKDFCVTECFNIRDACNKFNRFSSNAGDALAKLT